MKYIFKLKIQFLIYILILVFGIFKNLNLSAFDGTDGRGNFAYAPDIIYTVVSRLVTKIKNSSHDIEDKLKGQFGSIDTKILIKAIGNTKIYENYKVIKRKDSKGNLRPIRLNYTFNKKGEPQVIFLPSALTTIEAQLDQTNLASNTLIKKIERDLIKEASHFLGFNDSKADPFALAVLAVIGGYDNNIIFKSNVNVKSATESYSNFEQIIKVINGIIRQHPDWARITHETESTVELLLKTNAPPFIKSGTINYTNDQYHLRFTKKEFNHIENSTEIEILSDSIISNFKVKDLAATCRAQLLSGKYENNFTQIKDCYKLNVDFNSDNLIFDFSTSSFDSGNIAPIYLALKFQSNLSINLYTSTTNKNNIQYAEFRSDPFYENKENNDVTYTCSLEVGIDDGVDQSPDDYVYMTDSTAKELKDIPVKEDHGHIELNSDLFHAEVSTQKLSWLPLGNSKSEVIIPSIKMSLTYKLSNKEEIITSSEFQLNELPTVDSFRRPLNSKMMSVTFDLTSFESTRKRLGRLYPKCDEQSCSGNFVTLTCKKPIPQM
jgi:hypothetical protein